MGGWNPNEPGWLYPNQFIALIGPPGCGKGRVITRISEFLSYWVINLTTGEITSKDEVGEFTPDKVPLFTKCPEDLTYEDLIRQQAKSIRYAIWSKSRGEATLKPEQTPFKYGSCPMHVVLQELNTVLHRKNERSINYLLQAYDCVDFERSTIGRGRDVLKKPSLAFIGGITPEDLANQLDDSTMGKGLASRMWFIYEMVSGEKKWGFNVLDAEQRLAKAELLAYVRDLYLCYGRCEFSPEADAYLKQWYEVDFHAARTNHNPKLNDYYERKGKCHIPKMAMAMHFAENARDKANYTISLDTVKRAMEIFVEPERRMHHAMNFKGRNPLGALSAKVYGWLIDYRKPAGLNEILDPECGGFYNELNAMELQEVMRVLQATGKVIVDGGKYMPAHKKNLRSVVDTSSEGVKVLKPGDLPALPVAKAS